MFLRRTRPTAGQIVAELGSAQPAAGWLPWPAGESAATRPQGAGSAQGPTAPRAEPAGDRSPRPAHAPTVTSAHPYDPGNAATWPPQPHDPVRSRLGQRRPGLAWAAAAAAAVAVAALSIAAVAALPHRPATVQPAAGEHTGLTAPPRSAASSAGVAWTAYQDPGDFSIKLPPGWAASSTTATGVRFTGPQPGFVVLVAWTTQPQADQLADWRQQAAAKAQSDSTYQQICIWRIYYRGYNSADWEFTNMYQGLLTHVIDHGFIVTPGRLAYAIELYGPDASWSSVHASIWDELLQTFTPSR